MKKKLYIGAIVLVMILTVIGWFTLPASVVVQLDATGSPSTTLPKAFALLISIVLTLVGSYLGMNSEGDNSRKGFLVTIVGLAVSIFTLVMNLFIL